MSHVLIATAHIDAAAHIHANEGGAFAVLTIAAILGVCAAAFWGARK